MIINSSEKVSFLMSSADTAVCLMKICKNLMVHKGSFSALGALICDGNVYYTSDFEYKKYFEKKLTFIQ
tara:strand:- start:53 stop:259 length:207 start_codon:yes stop_codon:yes gene_type:complete